MTRRTRHTHTQPADTCRTTKKVYPTQAEATAELLAIAKRPQLANRPKQEDHSYLCPHCGGYHLTSAAVTVGKARIPGQTRPQEPQAPQDAPPVPARPGITQRLPQGPLAELKARLIQENR